MYFMLVNKGKTAAMKILALNAFNNMTRTAKNLMYISNTKSFVR